MQDLVTVHAPIYHKSTVDGRYILSGFLKVKAEVHENAPIAHMWQAVLALQNAPAAVFCAGDKATYMLLNGDTQHKEVWHPVFENQYAMTAGWMDEYGYQCTEDLSSIVFVDAGLIRTAPVPTQAKGFFRTIPAAFMLDQLKREARRQKTFYTRLRDNVQFLDLFRGEVVGCERLEAGRVGAKRKRNCAIA